MLTFQPIWYTIPEFARRTPYNMYHKENAADGMDYGADIRNLHILARAAVEAGKERWPGRYLIRITADDYYKLYINGVFVAQGPAPSYPEHYYYNTLDMTPYLTDGFNTVAVHLYYQGLVNRVWNSGDGRFGVAADLTDRKTGRTWEPEWKYHVCRAYSGEVTGYDTQFLENFDSRLWDEDWNQPGYRDEAWEPMVPAVRADYRFVRQPVKLLDVHEMSPCRTVEEDGTWFVDMGREITGALKLRACGRKGSRVMIRCGEERGAAGRGLADAVRYDMRCNCRYEETWTLDEGECELEPYDYKGFRYAVIIPSDGARILNIKAVVRHYPMDPLACMLNSSSGNLDRIFSICRNAVMLGTQEGYLDCPTREKGQYLGDAVITAHSQVWLTGSVEMLRKCIDQFARTSVICQGLMAVAPGSLMQEVADFSLLWTGLLMLDYQFTGDRKFLCGYYMIAKGMLTHFAQYAREDGLLVQVKDKWNLVDWPENLRDGYDFELSRPVVAPGCHNVINALYIGAARQLARMEEILRYPASVDWEGLKAAFIKTFYRPEKRLFADSGTSNHCSLHSNVYALYYGLAPEDAKQDIGDFLVHKGLECGAMVSYYYLKALAGLGRYEDMWDILLNESGHGWVNMLREGATACFEAWGKEQKWNTSLCHPWASAPIPVFIEDIAGFMPDPDRKHGFCLRPHVPEGLESFQLKLPFRGGRYLVKKTAGGRDAVGYYRIRPDGSTEEIVSPPLTRPETPSGTG
ncbi:MAG: family 78 glycoside hydrolase catalytic domain [Clostridiales bacterium]|nr:family 78 glycoside hydrolase catalytic domain [Clostridiales bacterium]